jgi:UDP-GlcNAc3NAcA epimerase
MKIVTIVGARPQFVKAAPFSREFRKKHTEILVHTGQHYDANMSDVFFKELDIPEPDYNLGVGSGSHGKQTGLMLQSIEEILLKEKPNGLLVYGDTNSTLAGALAASKLNIPVFHVEAGLRSFNRRMPEEQNRILTDHISELLLCPTETAMKNLKNEGLEDRAVLTGDIMLDAVLNNVELAENKYTDEKWIKELNDDNEIELSLNHKDFYLATVHRAENTDCEKKLFTILNILNDLDKPVLLPIHPRTAAKINNFTIKPKNLICIKPVGYLLMLLLIQKAKMVITDSGGLQKEAYFLKTPCTTIRDQTEWLETLEGGCNVLSPIDSDEITQKAQRNITQISYNSHPFGTGTAAQQICIAIEEYFM